MLLLLNLALIALILALIALMLSVLTCGTIALTPESIPSLFDQPVEVIIVFEVLSVEKVLENGSESVIVWPLFKS